MNKNFDKNINGNNHCRPDRLATATTGSIRRRPEKKFMNRAALRSCLSLLVVIYLALVPICGTELRAGGLSSGLTPALESNHEDGAAGTETVAGAPGQKQAGKPYCTDFNDYSLHGWAACYAGPNVNVHLDKPGPAGGQNDYYLRAKDQPGTSVLCAGPEYRFNWTDLASAGCSTLCFDVRIFKDGEDDAHTNITPSVVLVSDPDGNGPLPSVRAIYKANYTISEDKGKNPGWHHICVPIALSSGGSLPSNASGAWSMISPAVNSDWNNLLANVTELYLPINFANNRYAEVGYDNICLTKQYCPCVEAKSKEVQCKPGNSGSFTATIEVTNHSGSPVTAILLTPPAGSAFTLSQQQFILASPLLNGQSTNLAVGINNATPGQKICFPVTLIDAESKVCGCSAEVCITLPYCDCALFLKEYVVYGKNGTYTYTFTIVNNSQFTFANLYLFPPPGVTMTPSYSPINVPPLGQFQGTVTIGGAAAGSSVCFDLGFFDSQMNYCCRLKYHCIKLEEYAGK